MVAELKFWEEYIDKYKSTSLSQRASAVRVVYSDDSSIAYGGFTVDVGIEVAHDNWTVGESRKSSSSTWRELTAVERVLSSFGDRLAGNSVHWFTDNQAVARITKMGSRMPEGQVHVVLPGKRGNSITASCWLAVF